MSRLPWIEGRTIVGTESGIGNIVVGNVKGAVVERKKKFWNREGD